MIMSLQSVCGSKMFDFYFTEFCEKRCTKTKLSLLVEEW